MAELNKLVDDLSSLTVLEAAQLTKLLEEKWGVSAAAPMAMMAAMPAGGSAGAAAPAEEEKTEFTVILKDLGHNKIEVIKTIRQLTSLGLKEAKELAETPGAKVLEGASKDAAKDATSKLEAAGATIQVV